MATSPQKTAATDADERYGEIFDLIAHAAKAGMPLVEDPYPAIHKARSIAPVQKGAFADILQLEVRGGGFTIERERYSAMSFATVDRVLTNNLLFSSNAYFEFLPTMSFGRSILGLTGAEHRLYRGTVQSVFTKLRAQDWWADKWIKPLLEELVSQFEHRGKADLNQELCARLPMHTVTRAFGLDPDDAMEFRFNLMRTLNFRIPPDERQQSEDVCSQLLKKAIKERRVKATDDVISNLVHAEFKDEDGEERQLNDEEIVGFCKLILAAGGGTTWRQLGITIFALLQNPDQLEAVMADRKLIDAAIHESLRWHNTSPLFFRLTTEDTELGGVEIPKGSIVEFSLAGANRDPERWEDPDRYDLFRPILRHAAFGGGPHTCLGMFIAQEEMRLALNALFDRLPNMRFDPAFEPPRITGTLEMRGPSHLNVLFDPL